MKRIIITAAMLIAASLVACGGSGGQTATQGTVPSSESKEFDYMAGGEYAACLFIFEFLCRRKKGEVL